MRKEDIKSKTRFFVSILVVAAMIFGAFQGAVSAKGDSSQIIDSDTNNGGNEKGDTGIEDLRMDYSFSNPTVREVRYKSPGGTEIRHIVDLQGLPMHSNPGEPILPVKPVNILLPYDRDIEQINVTASEPVVLGTGYNIPIQQDPVKIGGKYSPTKDDKCTKEGSEYDGVEAFPGKLYDVVGVNYFRGFPILTVNLYPVQYVPKTGEIYYYEDIELNVKTNDGNPSPLYRGLENDMLRVKEMVDNPDVVSTYPGPYPHHSYDYVIITNESLNNTPGPYNWQALLDAKIAKGLGAKKVTVEWINTTFTGVDIQQKIRNFIRYAYENWHTEYVLLGGDSDDPGSDEYGNAVPARDLFFTTFPGDPSQDSDAQNAPSDLYYSCLDGTYNYDGDDKWGEPNDGENGGDVDLIPDVYVGRACVDNATEISNFVEKTLSYMNSADPYLNNVTLFGEYLGFGGVAEYAGNSLDQLINESANHGFYTVGIPNEPPADGRYAVMTMYDRDNGGDDSVTGWMMADRINNGTQLIIHDGHGNEDWVMNMSADHQGTAAFYHMNNTDKYFILYSIACDPGAFDNAGPVHGWVDDCIGEDLTVGSNGYGAVAVILNARYGWGYGNSTDGPGTTFERQFIDAIFGEGKRSLGEALADSKVDNLWRINEDCIRWTYFSENLLGDPELEVKPPEVKGNDAGVKEIKKPGTLVGTGLNTINATIENYGTNDLSSFNVNCSVYRLQKDVLFYDNMESGASKWTVVDNDGDGDSWSIVEPSDPSRYSSATHAFKCTPNAAYQSNADDDLISEAIDCSGYDSVTAEFYLWFSGQYDGWTSTYLDFGEVYLSDDDGATWTLVTTKRCYSSAYGNVSGLMYSFPVEKYVGLTSTVRIKFHWQSDSSTEREGMYVDDVQFYAFKVVNLDYGKDIATSLNSGTLTDLEFTGWNASAGWYAINVSTMLATDEYAANNYQNVTTYAKASKDVGVMMINSPTGLVATGNYTVNATVKNYGFDDQTGVVVQCVIKDSGSTTVFSDTETVDVDSDQTKFVEFDVWNANIEDTYTINVSTSLPGDEGPSNDYKEEVLTVANVPDMAVVSINYPPAGSHLGGYFNINVTIKNNGTVSPDTTLNCTIRDSTNAIVYAREITGISITPGEYKDFEFPTWDAVDEGTFDINVTTIAAGDVDPTNDYKNITVIIDNIDDVGATAINYPTGIQSTGSHIINATLENFGNINKTNVLANCSVEQVVSPVTLVSEDFEGYTPEVKIFPPSGWTIESYASGDNWTRGTDHDGDCAAVDEQSGQEQNEWLITPTIDCSALSGVHLKFWHHFYNSTYSGDSYGTVYGSTDGGTTWTIVANFTSSDSGEKDYDISSWADGQTNVKIAFKFYSTSGTSAYDYWHLDDVRIESVASSTFDTEGFESWPPAGWTLDPSSGDGAWQQDDGTTHGPGSVVDGSYAAYFDSYNYYYDTGSMITPSYDLSALSSPKMTFWWWDSSGSDDIDVDLSTDGGTTFAHHLATLTTTTSWTQEVIDLSAYATETNVAIRFQCTSDYGYSNPHIDDFWIGSMTTSTALEETFNESIPESGWPPAGWTVEVVSGTDTDNNWTISDGTGTHPSGITPFGDYMAQYNAYSISSGNSARIYSPAVDFSTATNHRMSFYMYHDSGYSYDDDRVVIQVSTDGSTWNNVTSILRYDASNPGWVKHDVDLSAYDGEPVVYVGFLGVSDYGNSIYIDNIEIGYGGVNILFSEEKTFDIPAYSTIYAEFGPWNVATEGNYTIEVTTLMPGDEDNGNNKTTTTVWINDIYDVGAISINYPVHGQTYNTGSYAVNATFENFGNVNLVNVPINLSVYKQLGGGTPLSEGFESGSIPAGWTVLNEDGDSYQWEAYSTTSAHSGSYVARVHYNYAGNDDWLITPRISIPSGATFTFWAKSYSSYYLEDFEVRLSTTGTDPSDFTTVLDSVTSTPYDWTEYSYDLSAYAGQNVYLAIRCISVNEFYLYIDDVEVSAIGGLDLVYSVDTTLPSLPGGETTYFTFPAWNATEEASYLIKATTLLAGDEDNGNNASAISITINNIKDVGVTDIHAPDVISTEMVCTVNATIESFGNYNLTTPFNVNCSIYDETSMLVFSDEVTIPGIDMGETVYANFAPWSPTAEGNYTINVTTLLAGDEDGSNDVAEKAIIVRDIDDVGVVSINSPVSGGGGGNTYDFESNDGGWIPTADWDPVGDWEWTNSYDVSNYVGSHTPPPSAHSGSGLWGTVLYNDYTNAGGTSYLNMTFDFSGVTGANMSFWSWSDIFGSYDYGRVLVNGDELLRIDDYDPTGWEYYTVDLSPYDGLSSVEISFAFYATTVVNYAGWYIDDVTINRGGSGGGSGNLQPGTYTVNATVENYGTVTETFDVNCIITSGGSAGTTSTLLSEGFEDAGCPAGWLNIDGDGDSYMWECDWNYSAHSGSLCAASASYINYVGALTPDNWLITPQIDLTPYASGELSYWVAAQDPDWPADHIEVWVSTTGTNISDFTDQIDDYTETSATWKQRTVDLSAYAGETIYLAFRHCDCTDNYWIKIDDVTVTGSTGGSGGTTVYTSTTTVTALAPGEQTFVEFVPPWAATPGEYTIQVATQLVGDEDTANDQASAGVTVGENQPPKSWHSPSNIESQHPTPGTHVWLYASDNDGFYDDYTLHYIVDNAGERTLTWNSSVSVGKVDLGGFAEGDHTIEYWAEDSAGNTETPHHVVTFYVMLEDKVSQTLRFDGYYGWTFNNWEITQDTLLYFDEDEASELNIVSIWYMIDNTGNWVKYTEPFTVPLGRHSIYFYGIDELGRRTPVARVVVEVLSNEAPTTACILTPSAPDGNNGWYTSDVRIKLAVTDPDGDSTTTKYRIDGGDWKEYTGEITLKESGRHTIQYYSIDSRQGLESVRERSISIDKVAPEITISQPTGHLYVFGREILPLPRERTVVIGKLNMNAEVTDQNLSGIDSIKIYINGELEDTFTEPQISWTWDEFAIGNREIKVTATDRAGNEASDAIEVIIFNL